MKIENNSMPPVNVRWCHMFAALILTETGQALIKPGFALGELLSKFEHEKTDAEAVQDQSEGGALPFTKKLCRSSSRP